MGEYADMMIDGDVCQVCGGFMEGGGGFPRTCRACLRDERKRQPKQPQPQNVSLCACGQPKRANKPCCRSCQRKAVHADTDRCEAIPLALEAAEKALAGLVNWYDSRLANMHPDDDRLRELIIKEHGPRHEQARDALAVIRKAGGRQ